MKGELRYVDHYSYLVFILSLDNALITCLILNIMLSPPPSSSIRPRSAARVVSFIPQLLTVFALYLLVFCKLTY